MEWSIIFFTNSILLGVGLAMDAFSLSVANGLNESQMKLGRMSLIAGTYGFFQFAMPMIGWICVHTIVEIFRTFEKFIPWIALALLGFIGGKMIVEALRKKKSPDEQETKTLTFGVLLVQGIATSIDALSVGFTIADYSALMATVCSIIIAVITFGICMCGLKIGKKIGNRLLNGSGILGGAILIFIGLEIFVKGVFF